MADSAASVGRVRSVRALARPPQGVMEIILHHNQHKGNKKDSVASNGSNEVELSTTCWRREDGQDEDDGDVEEGENKEADGENKGKARQVQFFPKKTLFSSFCTSPGKPRPKRSAIVEGTQVLFTAICNETQTTKRRIRLVGSLVEKKNFCCGLFTPKDEFLYGHRYRIQGIAWNGKVEQGAVPLLASVASDFELNKKGQKTPVLQQLFPMFFEADVPGLIGEVIIWDVVNKTPLLFINVLKKKELVDHGDDEDDEGMSKKAALPTDDERLGICGVCWSPDGESLACGGSNVVYLLNARTGRQLCKRSDLRWGKVDNNDVVDARCVAWSPQVQVRRGEAGSEDAFELLAWGLHASNYACSYIFLSAVRDVPNLKRKDVTPPKLAHQGQERKDVVFPLTFGKVTGLVWRIAEHDAASAAIAPLLLYCFSASACNDSVDPPDNSHVAKASVNTAVVWACDIEKLELRVLRVYMLDVASATPRWQLYPDSDSGGPAVMPAEDKELLGTFRLAGKAHPIVGDSRFVTTTCARRNSIAALHQK